MSNRSSPGERTAQRLAMRSDGLQRKDTADGGEVYTGALARAALRAMGARAMTLDQSIIVDEDFDLTRPEDQALYAHERHHQMESGGDGAEGERDHEEVAARAIERMVLHRAQKGEEFTSVMRSMDEGGSEPEGDAGENGASDPASAGPGSAGQNALQKAYSALLATGKSHQAVVNELARMVVTEMRNRGELAQWRNASSRSI